MTSVRRSPVALRPSISPLVYEINTRCWLRDLSAKQGRNITLANVPENEFDHWRRLGFTHLWLMGVWQTGPRSRAVCRASPSLLETARRLLPDFREEDLSGSPYAIGAYEVSEALGGETALDHFRDRLARQGLKLILDFVPNHTGLDHGWLKR